MPPSEDAVPLKEIGAADKIPASKKSKKKVRSRLLPCNPDEAPPRNEESSPHKNESAAGTITYASTVATRDILQSIAQSLDALIPEIQFANSERPLKAISLSKAG